MLQPFRLHLTHPDFPPKSPSTHRYLSGPRRAGSRLLATLVFAALLAAVLLPATGTLAADDVPSETDTSVVESAEVLADSGMGSVGVEQPAEEPPIEEPPTEESPVEEPAEPEPQGEDEPVLASVYVYTSGCPVGYDPTTKTLADFSADCTDPLLGTGFELAGGQYAAYQTTQSAGPAASATTFLNVPSPGTYTLAEDVPVGYGDPYVTCDGSLLAPAVGGAIQLTLSGDATECNFFNISLTIAGGDSATGEVHVVKYLCEAGTDLTNVNAGEALAICPSAQDGVSFDILSAGQTQTQTTGSSGPGRIDVEVPNDGTLTGIYETIPQGYGAPFVYCDTKPVGVDEALNYGQTSVNIADGIAAVEGNVPVGEGVFCLWFNVPEPDDDPYEGDAVNVQVIKRGCPAGYDAANASIDELRADCDDPTAGTIFTVSDDPGDHDQATIDAGDGSSQAYWNNLAPGTIAILETVPAGYMTPYFQCALNGQVLDWGFNVVKTFNEVEAGGQIVCEFFNLPIEGRVQIVKWVCPIGYEVSAAALDVLTQVCGGPAGGFEFTLDAGDQTTTATTEPIAYPDGPAHVIFESIPEGDGYAVTEDVPDGYETPVVWCTSATLGDFVQMTVVNGGVSFDLAQGDELFCQWFNIPTPDGDDDEPEDGPEPDGTPVVTTLPDTGSGSGSSTGAISLSGALLFGATTGLVAVTLLLLVGQAPAAVARVRRRIG